MTKALVKKYTLHVTRSENKKLEKLFHRNAELIDHEGNMRIKSAINDYFTTFNDVVSFRLHSISGSGTRFNVVGALEHENKSTRFEKNFVFEKGKIKSLVVKRF